MRCPSIDVSNATLSSSNGTYLSTVHVTCLPGYTAGNVTSYSISCLDNQTWSKPILKCEIIDCGMPPMVYNAIKKVTTKTTFGEEVVNECQEGTWTSRDQFSVVYTCGLGGLWTTVHSPICKVLTCPVVATWDGLVVTEVNATSREYGSQILISCLNGMSETEDNATELLTSCNKWGQWEPPLPSCKSGGSMTDHVETTEADSAQLIGGITVIVLSSLLVGALVSDIPSYRKGLSYALRNIIKAKKTSNRINNAK